MPKSPNVTVRVPQRSGFDKSHKNRLTAKVGTLVPILCDEIIPGTKINLRLALGVTLPPLASDTYMNVAYKVEAFFCPSRLLFGGYEDWFTQDASPAVDNSTGGVNANLIYKRIPQLPVWGLDLVSGDDVPAIAPGTLMDYLGGRFFTTGDYSDSPDDLHINPLPFLCYHMIWQEFYRAPLCQEKCFAAPGESKIYIANGSPLGAAMLPFIHDGINLIGSQYGSGFSTQLADGWWLDKLRQRNFGFDYFTNAYPSSSQPSMSVQSGTDFTIASLRASNSLQIFKERCQLAGTRLVDVVAARYGANLSSGVAQRPIFLGSASYEVYNRGVSITANGVTSQFGGNQNLGANPFSGQAGGRVGNGFGSGSDFLIKGFEANEPGYLMVIGSLVPRACYGSGVRRYLKRYTNGGSASITEMANPLLQNVGNDVIRASEIDSEAAIQESVSVFGYTDKFASFFNYEDEVHGLFRDGESLASFVLQRNFADRLNPPTLSSAFLEIPTDFMDDVTIAKAALSEYGYMLDVDFEYRVLLPMYPYSMPSLQDPAYEHGKPVNVHRGGFRF